MMQYRIILYHVTSTYVIPYVYITAYYVTFNNVTLHDMIHYGIFLCIMLYYVLHHILHFLFSIYIYISFYIIVSTMLCSMKLYCVQHTFYCVVCFYVICILLSYDYHAFLHDMMLHTVIKYDVLKTPHIICFT